VCLLNDFFAAPDFLFPKVTLTDDEEDEPFDFAMLTFLKINTIYLLL
jgi:hypothetical protein